MKLGCKPSPKDPRTLKVANYTANLPKAPAKCDWTKGVKAWGMMKNDQIGDCVIVTAAHLIMEWTNDAQGKMVVTPDSEVVKVYSAITGYDPRTGANDNGTNVLDRLKYWQKTGIYGHKIAAYASAEVANLEEIKQSVYLFGAADVAFDVPSSWMNSTATWDVTRSSFVGGHSVPIVGYDDKEQTFTLITWGRLQKVTYKAYQKYFTEAWSILSPDWLTKKGWIWSTYSAPNGFDLAALQKDLVEIGK